MIVLCLIVSLATFETKANLISQVGHIKPWPTLAPGWRMARRPPCLELCGPICCFRGEVCIEDPIRLWNYVHFFKWSILQNIWYCSFCMYDYEPPTPKPKRLECYQGDRGEPCGPRCCKRDEVCKRVNYVRLWNSVQFFKMINSTEHLILQCLWKVW